MASTSIVSQIIEALNSPQVLAKVADVVAGAILPQINSSLDIKLGTVLELQKENQKKIETLEEKASDLTVKLKSKDSQLDDIYQYSRRNNVRVFGIRENKDEDTDNIVLKLADEMGVKLTISDIERSHRTGDPSKYRSRSRPIIVKFMSDRKKRELMKNLSKLKGRPGQSKVFINDDLTKERSRIAADARELVATKKLAGSWVRDGIIFVKKLDGQVSLITKRHQFDQLIESLRLKLRLKLSQGPHRSVEYINIEDSDVEEA